MVATKKMVFKEIILAEVENRYLRSNKITISLIDKNR
jgi:hypothetical protein